jgi:tRNA threonylcarbamoyladenosine biosynthesis protein TsaE
MKIITKSEKETFDFAKKFARTLKGGEVIGLIGELGAGKTIFTKGLAAGLGIKNVVNSPTFVLMKVYDIKNKTSQIKRLVHVDAYRIKLATEASNIGLEDFLNKKNILAIEWPQNIKIKTNILITIISTNQLQRTISIKQNN